MRPFVSQCAVINNIQNKTESRCKNIPDSSGYFCAMHRSLLHKEKLHTFLIRDMPYVIKATSDYNIVFNGSSSKNEVDGKKPKGVISSKGTGSKVIDFTKGKSNNKMVKTDVDGNDKNSYINRKVKELRAMSKYEIVKLGRSLGIRGLQSKKAIIKLILVKMED